MPCAGCPIEGPCEQHRKHGTEQPNTATGDTTPTTNDRQTARLGLLPGGRLLARGDVVHEGFHIVPRDEATDFRPGMEMMWRAIRPRSEISALPADYVACKAQPTVVEGENP